MRNARPFLLFLTGAAAGAGIVYAVTREELMNDVSDLARRTKNRIADRLHFRKTINVMGEEIPFDEDRVVNYRESREHGYDIDGLPLRRSRKV